jgi:hypothetical protein
MFGNWPEFRGHVKGGKLVALGMATAQAIDLRTDHPHAGRAGLKLESNSWNGLLAPAYTRRGGAAAECRSQQGPEGARSGRGLPERRHRGAARPPGQLCRVHPSEIDALRRGDPQGRASWPKVEEVLTMGQLALAAKITHVPSMYLSELDGPRKGTRQDAIDGHIEIARRCRALGVDTIVVFDTHWLVNANYHVNCAPHFKGLYTSNELPHFISNMDYEFPGNPALGQLLARVCRAMGVETLAHDATTLAPEYGTLVPMRYMNADQHFKVVSVSALCTCTT